MSKNGTSSRSTTAASHTWTSQIGKLIAELKQRGLYENTLIIVTADHGEAIGDHGLMEHAVDSLYQDQIHVPLLIKYPGRHEARTTDMLVSHVDIMPTVLDTLGYSAPSGIQGRSIGEEEPADRVVYSEAYPNSDFLRNLERHPRFQGIRRAIFSDRMKLIVWTKGPAEFYDLSADPNESLNRYQGHEEFSSPLMLQIASWTKSMPAPAHSRMVAAPQNLDALRSLGYVQ